ncbi:hypothetical protein LZP69_09620 [Shewanella sp. AS1]|uniref:hypothetical protein n=1 Tax=Shewanella sp. AS1 TaxID=2907626 RepID=UPI001F3B6D70|nr:hypothetical protein [Shewanella sp. AS1]MCE9679430.1 hypothetical protein [Shewanella sp. AS1]
MKIVVDSQGREIGNFDGNLVKDSHGKVIYWISDEDVFAPNEYADEDLHAFNKGQFSKIGEYDGGLCTSNNEVIFEIK